MTIGEQKSIDDLVKEGIVMPNFPWRKDRIVLRRHLYGIALYWQRFKVDIGRFSQELMEDSKDEANWENKEDAMLYQAIKDMDIYAPDTLEELELNKEVEIGFFYKVI